MTTQQKQQITERTAQTIERKGLSQNRYAKQAGVSPATITAILQGNWDMISEKMWLKLAIACDYNFKVWMTAETSNFNRIMNYCQLAQRESMSIGISWYAGAGKSHAYKEYTSTHKNTFYLECADHWTRRIFMDKFIQAMGLDADGLKVVEKAEIVIAELRKRDNPLVILDEVDKLKEGPFMFFIELYNKLDGYAGFILSGAPFLRKHVEKGVSRDRKGYREIYSRIGRKFIELDAVSRDDVTQVCATNGITEMQHINEIFNDCEGDLRRVKRSVEILKAKLTKYQAA